jgi:hypothetical protein
MDHVFVRGPGVLLKYILVILRQICYLFISVQSIYKSVAPLLVHLKPRCIYTDAVKFLLQICFKEILPMMHLKYGLSLTLTVSVMNPTERAKKLRLIVSCCALHSPLFPSNSADKFAPHKNMIHSCDRYNLIDFFFHYKSKWSINTLQMDATFLYIRQTYNDIMYFLNIYWFCLKYSNRLVPFTVSKHVKHD